MNRIEFFSHISKEFPNGRGVEVGTFKGEFSNAILSRWDGILYMVDVWRGIDEGYDDVSNHNNHTDIWKSAMDNIDMYYNRAIMIRTTSENASKIFNDSSLDFVYIDANHSYESVKNDILLWYPKVKSGGYLWGHDYLKINWSEPPFAENGKDKYIWSNDGGDTPMRYAGVFGVNPAVDEFCTEMGYLPVFTDEWDSSWCIKKK